MSATTRIRREQGMALIAVMLLLMAMSALAAALAISSTTETMIARNHQASAEARAAAEAGLVHAIDLTLSYLAGFAAPATALDGLLADPSLAGIDDLQSGGGFVLAGAGSSFSSTMFSSFASTRYVAYVLDDDNEAARDIELSDDDVMRIGENGDIDDDENATIIVRAIGFSRGNAVAAVEATIGAVVFPALITDGDLAIKGNVNVSGTGAGLHANEDLTISGGAFDIDDGDATAGEECTASGGATAIDGCDGSQPEIGLPNAQANNYRALSDFILTLDGTVTDVNDNVVCDASTLANNCEMSHGWTFNSGTQRWSPTDGASGTFFVESDFIDIGAINVTLTIFTNGSIDITGNANITPDTPGIAFVIDGDLSMSGNSEILAESLIVVGEQLDIGGNVTIRGQVIVQNNPHDVADGSVDLVSVNDIHGSVQLIYNGSLDTMFYAVSAWRRSY